MLAADWPIVVPCAVPGPPDSGVDQLPSEHVLLQDEMVPHDRGSPIVRSYLFLVISRQKPWASDPPASTIYDV